eukprot:CAMPEP_0185740040 /NCGR_PEP_ID=MMETSP1171-20130828/36836_1 /TAXON_ID=374046 /ORGANISM="Helicotheca tamensis, Strain CCMP826" /LENGTH=258 /DNA_ID=CAMNT_0028411775 /DNA_START=89 /DNA_END=865 /DNA_ORIENTATION=-
MSSSNCPNKDEDSIPISNTNNDANNVEIKYSYVGGDGQSISATHAPTNHTKIARYAAFEQSRNNSTWKPLTIQQWATYLSKNNEAAKKHRQDFVNILANSTPHMKAYAFETKGASHSTANTRQFEFVLVDSPYLDNGSCDPYAFQDHFQSVAKSSNAPACVFPNLGNDAILVAPLPLLDHESRSTLSNNKVYPHLATFVRNGPSWQVNEFWRMVTTEYLKVLNERQVWLSTAGGGVDWLHVRLGKRPKYYRYDEFRSE